MKKLVSIVIPVYNGSRWIERTLYNLTKQTYSEIECVIVNDGSNDNSMEIVYEFIFHASRIKFKTIDSLNLGAGAARNIGIENSSGDYIAFLDQDDVWSPNKIQLQVNFLESDSQFLGVLCDFAIGSISSTGKLSTKRIIRTDNLDGLARGWLSLEGNGAFVSSALMIRNDLKNRTLRFDPDFSHVADLDYFLQLIKVGQIGYIGKVLVGYCQHEFQMHSDAARMKKDYSILVDKYSLSDYELTNNRVLGNMFAMSALLDLRAHRYLDGLADIFAAFKISPLSIIRIPICVISKRIGSTYQWIRREPLDFDL